MEYIYLITILTGFLFLFGISILIKDHLDERLRSKEKKRIQNNRIFHCCQMLLDSPTPQNWANLEKTLKDIEDGV